MRVMLWGGRSTARIAAEMVNEIYESKATITGVFDKTLKRLPFNSNLKLYSDYVGLKTLCAESSHFVVCVGGEHGLARCMIADRLIGQGLKPLDLISPYGLLDKLEQCGRGVQVMPGAIVHKFSVLGDQCIINSNSTVDHECVLERGVHVMGGASIAGRVSIGEYSTIGTNATVLPDLKIGRNVFVGAGAVVTKDVKDNLVVAGVPARPLRENDPVFDPLDF